MFVPMDRSIIPDLTVRIGFAATREICSYER